MCHQSGGLIQRMIEQAGIPTVALANLRAPVRNLQYPRAALVRFPRGATVGAPGDATTQTAVLKQTLALLETGKRGESIVELSEPWQGD